MSIKMVGSVHRLLPKSYHESLNNSFECMNEQVQQNQFQTIKLNGNKYIQSDEESNDNISKYKFDLIVPNPKRRINIKFRLEEIKDILCDKTFDNDLLFTFDDL